MAYLRIGDLLLNHGLITNDQLEAAIAAQKETKQRLGATLITLGYVTEQQFIEALQRQLGIDYVDLTNTTLPTEMAQILPKTIAKKHDVVPIKLVKDNLHLAMKDPMNFLALEEVKKATRKNVIPVITNQVSIDKAIISLYGNEGAARAIDDMRRGQKSIEPTGLTTIKSTSLEEDAAAAPTVRLVNSIIERAINERASDIHIEPTDDGLKVRMRVDGLLRNILTVPADFQSSVISRLKIMGNMDISEKRVPQDGRSNVTIGKRDMDLRMSTLPTIYGEKFVIRLLDKDTTRLSKAALGLTGPDEEAYDILAASQSGVILIVGPTGSGKTSTMYTLIRDLNKEQTNLVTLEDPVEYNISGVNQIQINEKTGMTFASGLRSILRQDPDVIAVGEIRDGETAQIAMRAAITGHVVLSTIHTNSVISTLDRLMDIGVEHYIIAAALRGICSQRLVRKICPHCRKEVQVTEHDLRVLGIDNPQDYVFYEGEGCPECYGTGFNGRTAVFEILIITPKLRNAIADSRSREDLERIIAEEGGQSFIANCRKLLKDGTTTIAETVRVISSTEL